MMEIISERSTVDGIKNYLNDNITDQLWAKDVVSEAASIHYQNLEKNNCSAMIMIGNSGIGRTKLLKLLSVFFRVPFLKCDVKTLFGYTSNPACYIFPELLKLTSNNIEKASLGIVYLENVNTLDKITQKEFLKLIKVYFNTHKFLPRSYLVPDGQSDDPITLLTPQTPLMALKLVGHSNANAEQMMAKRATRYIKNFI
ncbi:unnamed protein product [Diamesa hyperborea]